MGVVHRVKVTNARKARVTNVRKARANTNVPKLKVTSAKRK